MQTTNMKEISLYMAARAVVRLRHGLAFDAVYLPADDGTYTLVTGEIKNNFFGYIDPSLVINLLGGDELFPDQLVMSKMAGIAALKIADPAASYASIIKHGSGCNDYEDTLAYLELRLAFGLDLTFDGNNEDDFSGEVDEIIEWRAIGELGNRMRGIQESVQSLWTSVIKLQEALLVAPNRTLNRRECEQVLGLDWASTQVESESEGHNEAIE